jgi:DNA-binding protein Fis
MDRDGNNQTLAARLLGIFQPALSKRLKMSKE